MTDLKQKVKDAVTDDGNYVHHHHRNHHHIDRHMIILQLVYPDPGQSLRVVLSPNSVRSHHHHHCHACPNLFHQVQHHCHHFHHDCHDHWRGE